MSAQWFLEYDDGREYGFVTIDKGEGLALGMIGELAMGDRFNF